MKKLLKSRLFFFILGAIIFSSGTVFAYSLMASDVSFLPKDTNWEVDDVDKALNELYSRSSKNLMNIESTDINGTYIQAHGSSNNHATATLNKGNYLVALIYSYSGGMTSANYSYYGTSGITL